MRTSHWMIALFVLLLFAAPIAMAPHAVASDAVAEHEGDDDGGIPGFLKLDVAAVVVALVTFFVLLFLLTKLAWKPILSGLQQREDTIRQAVDGAQQANEEARALAATYQEKLDAAKADAQAIADESRKNADALRLRIEDDARKQAEATLARAVREIQQAKDTALDELLNEVTAIAAEAASRIVKKEISPEANAPLVDDVIESFVQKSKGTSA